MSSYPPNIMKKIGVWISDKKSQKLNWKELTKTCSAHGYQLIKMNLNMPLEEQENIDVFLHKLTDILAAADQGDPKASHIISHVEQYLSNHPNITVVDPLDNVRILLNRYNYYTLLDNEQSLKRNGIFTPAFAEFTSDHVETNIAIMKERGVNFPVICKPTVAHGSKLAHEMIVIFNEKDLKVCKPPCVVQSFVNHNAVLHKVFLIGNRYHICERPSLKNFYPSDNLKPIFYSTGEVCKADSQSTLSILDPHDHADMHKALCEKNIELVIKFLRKKIGLLLAGFDVVIDNVTGYHAVIDINVFPSYDNFPNFFEHLLECIDDAHTKKTVRNISTENVNCVYDQSNSEEYVVDYSLINGLVNVGCTLNRHSTSNVNGMNIDS